MRRPIEKLARLILARKPDYTKATVGDLAKECDEEPERIIDALAVVTILGTCGLDGDDDMPITYTGW